MSQNHSRNVWGVTLTPLSRPARAHLYEGLTDKATGRVRQKCRSDFGPTSGLFIVPKDGAAPFVAGLDRLLSDPGNLTQSKSVFREMGLTYDRLIKEIKKSKNEG